MIGRVHAFAVAAALVACGAPEERTQVMLRIDGDDTVRASIDRLLVEVEGGPAGALAPSDTFIFERSDIVWPLEIALVPSDNDASRVYRVVATAYDAANGVIAVARVESGYVARRTLVLSIALDTSCPTTCAADQTCVEGDCVDAQIDPSVLPDYVPPGGHDGGTQGDGGTLPADAGCGSDDECASSDPCFDGVCNDGACELEPRVCHLSVGVRHNCILRGREALCWGANSYGVLGDGTEMSRGTAHPPNGLPDILAVTAGSEHTCAIDTEHWLWCWGRNLSEELGDGTTTSRDEPIRVMEGVSSVFLGHEYTCVLRMDGVAECFGRNDNGQIGVGTVGLRDRGEVMTDRRYTQLSCTSGHACGVTTTGEVDCWGAGDHGKIGTIAETQPTPITVPGLTNIVEVSNGAQHTCARSAAGLWCWGNADWGQLGDASATSGNFMDPRPVAPLAELATSGAVQIAAGYFHTCAIYAGREVACWGENDNGELGNGTMTRSLVPARVDLPGAEQIGAGFMHTCALRDGEVYCWGSNADFAVGGTDVIALSPMRVSL